MPQPYVTIPFFLPIYSVTCLDIDEDMGSDLANNKALRGRMDAYEFSTLSFLDDETTLDTEHQATDLRLYLTSDWDTILALYQVEVQSSSAVCMALFVEDHFRRYSLNDHLADLWLLPGITFISRSLRLGRVHRRAFAMDLRNLACILRFMVPYLQTPHKAFCNMVGSRRRIDPPDLYRNVRVMIKSGRQLSGDDIKNTSGRGRPLLMLDEFAAPSWHESLLVDGSPTPDSMSVLLYHGGNTVGNANPTLHTAQIAPLTSLPFFLLSSEAGKDISVRETTTATRLAVVSALLWMQPSYDYTATILSATTSAIDRSNYESVVQGSKGQTRSLRVPNAWLITEQSLAMTTSSIRQIWMLD
ncbi:uncharacterized protein MYCFIDRAFT_209297 [Pseudocercospora fijiensis CIRAD86]|uniref:Uncharacterized protein n=1 Tax=Pseudocercospora fijiensis (strain CIRAD86) TaxID=383855 RepID=M2ZYR5_PSEFD|nr:uncharacterized protein MYCFIDRAFT_209297 [Pseudocercospora fijiensis CIRAD86]EME77251.1 hypothetical protein MYCFIDRAFT_209297 [Pseudocercospora fijiensis CIRAD86]